MLPKKIKTSKQSQIKQVSLGLDHGLLFFEDGQVYHFDCAMNSSVRETNANEISFSGYIPTGNRVIKILCHKNSCIALLDNGKVCKWVNNHDEGYYSIPSSVSFGILEINFNVIDICNRRETLFLLIDNN